MIVIRAYRKLIVTVALLGVTGSLVAACGAGHDTAKLQQQGVELQKQGLEIQKQAAKAQADVASGKKSADQASQELQKSTEELQHKAADTADTAIDQVKGQAGLPDAAKEQLETAQAQLDAAQR